VRGEGELAPLRLDQPLDALGGAVEAPREVRHLVPTFDRRTRREVAAAQRLHPRLEPLEPAGQPPDERPRSDTDRHGEQRQRREQPETVLEVRLTCGHEPASVGKAHGEHQVAADPGPVPACAAGVGQRQPPAHPGEELTVPPVHRGVHAEARTEAVERRLQLLHRAIGPGQELDRCLRDRVREAPLLAQPRRVPPGRAGQDGEEGEHRDDRQVDLRPQPAHHSSSCLRANT
jgi:hypothetical protein